MINSYECICAKNLKTAGLIMQAILTVIGVVLLFVLFDDWNMMWLYAIVSCAVCCLTGFVNRLLFDCIAVITENQYKEYVKNKNESAV